MLVACVLRRARRGIRQVRGSLRYFMVMAIALGLAGGLGSFARAEAPAHKAAIPAKASAPKPVVKKAAAKPAKKPATKPAAAKIAKAKTAAHAKKPLTAAERKKAAIAARKKEAARVARIIRAAGPAPGIKKQYDGVASFYSEGQRLASGGRFNPGAMTAAHRSLPFGTKVQVTDKHTGRKVTVTINDRGPFKKGRVIDLSRAAARALGMGHRGVSRVHVAVLPKHPPAKKVAAKAGAKKKPVEVARASLRKSADAAPGK